jgi:cytochrome c
MIPKRGYRFSEKDHALAWIAGLNSSRKELTELIMRSLPLSPITALAAAVVIVSGNCARGGDPVHGEHLFAKCAPCHAKDNSVGLGPGLLGVVGRHAGSTPGFRYSRAMKTSNIVWDEKSLDAFITAPQKALPGTAMPFAGVPDQLERTDLIAYLETLK